MTEKYNEEIVIEESSLVGQRLREAREAKKITIAEVAAQLRLTKDSIRYLEENQWGKLHGRAYARGYFSSYVNFLSLPQDELLAAFNFEYKTSAVETNVSQLVPQKKSRLLVSILIFIVLALMGITSQLGLFVDNSVNELVEIKTTVESEELDAFSSSVVEPLLVPADEQIVDESIQPAVGLEALTEEVSTNLEGKLIESAVTEEQSQLEIPKEISVENESITDGIIELQFSEDSWVEITDADKQVLTKRIGEAGGTITFSGRPPLEVLLGHAAGVTVKYNDEEINITQYTNNDVARFSLGVEL